MTTMTDTDIVEALAKKEGYVCIDHSKEFGPMWYRGPKGNTYCGLPDYLNDRNALQPILDGLTEEEIHDLEDEIDQLRLKSPDKYGCIEYKIIFGVRMKPRDLAICLVKALKLGKE